MAADGELISPLTLAVWSTLLTIVIGFIGYMLRKRDDKLDEYGKTLETHAQNHSALELKVAENYATKTTVMALFQDVTTQNKEAVARVEKRIDETNAAIGKQGEKIDKVLESVNNFQTNVMSELAKKT